MRIRIDLLLLGLGLACGSGSGGSSDPTGPSEPTYVTAAEADFTFDGTGAVTSYVGAAANVIVPPTLKGKPVKFAARGLCDVTSIAAERLENVRLPAGVNLEVEGVAIGIHPGSHCSKLLNIFVDPADPSYQSIDGVLFSKDGTRLIGYPPGRPAAAYSVPAGVKSLANEAFFRSMVTAVALPTGLVTLGAYAFDGCTRLTAIDLPATLTILNSFSFSGTPLTQVTIPSSVIYIGQGAFLQDTSLTSVTMLAATPPTLQYTGYQNDAFDATAANLLIHVPGATALTRYRKDANWAHYASHLTAQ